MRRSTPTESISARVSPDLHKRIRDYCDSVNITHACFVREALEEYLKTVTGKGRKN